MAIRLPWRPGARCWPMPAPNPGVTLVDLDLARVDEARRRVPSLGHDRGFDGP